MIKNSWLLFLLLCVTSLHAQYTDVINSNRPGVSESAYSVGKGVFQIENGIDPEFVYFSPGSRNYLISNSLVLRHGILSEKLELNAIFKYQFLRSINSGSTTNKHVINPYGIGLKYLIYHHKLKDQSKEIRSWKKRTKYNWSRLIPSVAVSTRYLRNSIDPSIGSLGGGIFLQNELSNYWNLTTNLYYDGVGANIQEYSAIFTSTYTINETWAVYGESHNIFRNNTENIHELSSGLAYLINQNLQVDASVKTGIVNKNRYLGISAGVSWRLDRHVDVPLDTIKKQIFKKGFEKTKEAVIVAAITTGQFFKKTGNDIGIFFTNIFRKKGNKIKRDRKPKKEKKKKEEKKEEEPDATIESERPTRGKLLLKEMEARRNPPEIKIPKDSIAKDTIKKSLFSKLFKKKKGKKKEEKKITDTIVEKENKKVEIKQDSVQPKKKGLFSKLFKKKEKKENEEVKESQKKEEKNSKETIESIQEEPKKKKKKGLFSRLFKKKQKESSDKETIDEKKEVEKDD